MPTDSSDGRFEIISVKAIVDALPAMIAYWRRDLICLHANDSYLHWFGRTREEVVGHHIRDVIGATPFELNRPYIDGVLRGEPQSFERELVRPDGKIAVSTANYVPDFDETADVRGFYVIVADITHLRRTEEQLRANEAELRKLLQESREAAAWQNIAEEVAHMGHWRTDLRARTVVWSPEVYRILGIDSETFKPDIESGRKFYHEDDRQRVSDFITRAIETGAPFEYDARIVRPDDVVRTVRARGMSVADESGRPASLFGVFIDITDQVKTEVALRAENEQLGTMAHRDALTSLPNRRAFDMKLEQEWHAAVFTGTPISLVMIDVDFFKKFNDRFGHQAGDDCLRAVGTALGSALRRPGDQAARYGGEEFALLLPGARETGGTRLAQQARSAVEGLAIPHPDNPLGGSVVTVSLGVATAWPTRGGSIFDLLSEADAFLYEAKRAGRNRVVDGSTMPTGIKR